MPEPTIKNGEEHFFNILYEGNGGGQRVGKFVPFTDSGTIANSVIFNDADNAYLSRTNDAGDRTRVTISFWVKRGNVNSGNIHYIFTSYDGSSTNDGYIRFNTNNTIATRIGSGSSHLYITNRTFEDTSKWYHIMLSIDTNLSTAADRVKLYVDGDRITSFSTQTNAGSADTTQFNYSSATFRLGSTTGGAYDFDGYLAEFNQVDGQALLPASFGETNTSTGRWVPATVRPYPTTTTTYTVTVVGGNPSNHPYYNVGSSNKFAIDGSTATSSVTLNLKEGATYRFDQSDNSNSGHPLRFSTTANGTHGGGSEYTVGVTTNGTPGSSGAYTEITVASGSPTLYYYCTNHSAMGWTANTLAPYGTNGFRLQFGTSSALGDDTSGNENDFSVTNLVAGDQTTDSPTQNHATIDMNTASNSSMTFAEGNLNVEMNNAYPGNVLGTLGASSGKYYWEVTLSGTGSSANGYATGVGVAEWSRLNSDPGSTTSPFSSYIDSRGYYFHNGTNISSSTTFTAGDVISIALNLDDSEISYYKNNTIVGSAQPLVEGQTYFPLFKNSTSVADLRYTPNFGQKSWNYTPPTDFVALQQDNLPAETAKGISGSVWIKNRDSTDLWIWQDSLRGRGEYGSPATATQYNSAITDGVQKFLKGGVQIEDNVAVNTSGESYVAFNWVLNNGTNVTDTSGDLSTELQANPTAGVSVGKFTVSGSGNKTWSHGLGGVPEVGILCAYSSTNSGTFYHHKISTTPYSSGLFLINSNSAFTSSNIWGSAKPTSTLWTGLVGSLFSAGETYIFYSFRGIEGFSKCSSYTGNGNANGSFVYTGFKPSFLMIKCTTHANNWVVYNNKMNPFNPVGANLGTLFPNRTNAAETQGGIDFCSNGFKARSTYENFNGSGRTYVYMAFAEHPFIGDGTSPVTAR